MAVPSESRSRNPMSCPSTASTACSQALGRPRWPHKNSGRSRPPEVGRTPFSPPPHLLSPRPCPCPRRPRPSFPPPTTAPPGRPRCPSRSGSGSREGSRTPLSTGSSLEPRAIPRFSPCCSLGAAPAGPPRPDGTSTCASCSWPSRDPIPPRLERACSTSRAPTSTSSSFTSALLVAGLRLGLAEAI